MNSSAYSATMDDIKGTLTVEQLEKFHKDGYLLIENFLTDSECDTLKDACHRIIKDADFTDIPKVIFDTVQHKQAYKEYFMQSAVSSFSKKVFLQRMEN